MAASTAGRMATTRASSIAEHDVWTLADPQTRRLARTLSDHVIEVTDGDEVGYGIVEYGVGKGYARYRGSAGPSADLMKRRERHELCDAETRTARAPSRSSR